MTDDRTGVFLDLLVSHEARLRAFAMTLVPNRADVDDILQHTRLELWQNFDRFELGTNFMGWAARVVYFTVCTHRKRKFRDKVQFGDAYIEAMVQATARPDASDELGDREQALADCIAALRPEQRKMLKARYEAEYDMDQMVNRFQRSRMAIYSALLRIRRMVFDCVNEKIGMRRNMNRFHSDEGPTESAELRGDADECWQLMSDQLDGQATAQQRLRLEQMIVESPSLAIQFLSAAHLWATLTLDGDSEGQPHPTLDDILGAPPSALDMLNEAMILPALRDGDEPQDSARLAPAPIAPTARTFTAPVAPAAPAPVVPSSSAPATEAVAIPADAPFKIAAPPKKRRWLGPGRSAGIAAVIALAAGTSVWLLQPHRPPATVTATAGAVINGSLVDPGTPITVGETLSVTQGGVELTLDSGAVAVVAAPARLTILDRNSIALAAGSMTAHVPPSALGFQVNAPGLSMIDRGTNFGVRTSADTSQTVLDVFDGKVDATPLDDHGVAIAQPVRVTGGHAVQHRAKAIDAKAVDAPYEPDRFARTVADVREPLPLHGSGADVALGFADSHWSVVSVPNDPAWQPRPAYAVTRFAGTYPRNEADAKWISVQPDLPLVDAGSYVFRTTVDLTGYDAASANIAAQVTADDGIANVRVNGQDIGVTPWITAKYDSPSSTHLLRFPNLFHGGANEVEIVLTNTFAVGSPGGKSGCGLKWKWVGTASRPVRR